jgi:hypothetical protein
MKAKAEELVNKFTDVEDGEMYIGKAKECALIAVDEILLYLKNSHDVMTSIKAVDYWNEVKTEIELL